MAQDMKNYLKLDLEKIEKMTQIKKDYIEGKTDFEATRKLIKENFDKMTASEFAYSEQKIKELGFDDNTVHDKMNDVLGLFEDIIVKDEFDLPEGHPINTYILENEAARKLIAEMKEEFGKKFIKNRWLELYEKLSQFNPTHLARKQHQLFSILEKKGFDRPSRIMWSFDNNVRDSISEAYKLLENDKIEEFLEKQENVWELTLDIMHKEEEVLFPTSMKMISEEEFKQMRAGDDEIGYFLIDKPTGFYPENIEKQDNNSNQSVKEETVKSETGVQNNQNAGNFMNDLASLMAKYNMGSQNSENEVFDVKQGKLTLEQINLIFQHMPVDLSFVDENEIVKFYTDTKHRVFPRSAGVIGRDVKNCHPRESVSSVLEIIDAFRKGEQDEIDFWLEMRGKFIYIYYVAVRDENGVFKGVLEMMQDVTKIRSLTGERRLVTWENKGKDEKKEETGEVFTSKYNLTGKTVIGDIVKKYPYIREYMPLISPEYKKLLDPIQYMMMSKIATLQMIAMRGELELDYLIMMIEAKIDEEENK